LRVPGFAPALPLLRQDAQYTTLRKVKVLDVRATSVDERINPFFPSLETIRLVPHSNHHDYPVNFPLAPTCVVFTSLVGRATLGPYPWQTARSPYKYPWGLQKLVLNIEYNQADMATNVHISVEHEIREIVYIFTHTDRIPGIAPERMKYPTHGCGVFCSIVNVLAHNASVETFTVVDAAHLDPRCYGRCNVEMEDVPQAIRDLVHSNIAQRRNMSLVAGHANWPLPEVKVLSGDEYAASVGKEQYEIETQRP
jgi:hypothetical protein